VPNFASRLRLRLKTVEKELKETKTELITYKIDDFLNDAEKIGTHRLFVSELEDLTLPDLEYLVKTLVAKDHYLIAVAGAVTEKAMLAGATGEQVPDIGLLKVVREAASLLGGGAGGGPTFARGGGPKRANLKDALKQVKSVLTNRLHETE
ncbi:MAG: DHHA1 domain-containing protein, partial [Candidatus Hodarchaeota archaeon]